MAVFGKEWIDKLLSTENVNERLFITPLLNPKQVGGASVDVRLGFDFVTVKRGNIGLLDAARLEERHERFRSSHYLNLKQRFYLHPNEMALASTLEYVRLPLNVAAYVTSRSKWGRLGLIIATATAIHPGFAGTITLELVNHGNVPIVLYPGDLVAQLVLNEARGAIAYSGPLAHQTGPYAATPSDRTAKAEHEDRKFWYPQTKSDDDE
jgi:dCTP deaminase